MALEKYAQYFEENGYVDVNLWNKCFNEANDKDHITDYISYERWRYIIIWKNLNKCFQRKYKQ